MKSILFLTLLLISIGLITAYPYCETDPVIPCTATHTFGEAVQLAGYAFENHSTITDDGYIINMFRIPRGKNEAPDSSKASKPPIFLMHGLLADADQWVIEHDYNAIGFLLANNGFDVWFGNARGVKYNLEATDMDYHDDDFWRFTWNDIGQHDIPAMIKYVTAATGYSKIPYIGHSQGTVVAWASMTDNASWKYMNSAISVFIALAPAPFVSHTSSPLLKTGSDYHLAEIMKLLGVNSFLLPEPYGIYPEGFTTALCEISQDLCNTLAHTISGIDPNLGDDFITKNIVGHMPSGTSIKNMVMWSQQVQNPAKFQKYNYGSVLNLYYYLSVNPPVYDLSRVTVPTAMFVGELDVLADKRDAFEFKTQLDAAGNSVIFYQEYPQLGHLGFIVDENMDFFKMELNDILAAYPAVKR